MSKIENLSFGVVGVTFKNDNGISRQTIISKMTKDTPIGVLREKNNRYDKNAIAIMTPLGQIGYIGKQYAAILAPMIDQGKTFSAHVEALGSYNGTNYCKINVNEVSEGGEPNMQMDIGGY